MSTNNTPNGTGHGGPTPPHPLPRAQVALCMRCHRPATQTVTVPFHLNLCVLAFGVCEEHMFDDDDALGSRIIDLVIAVLISERIGGGAS